MRKFISQIDPAVERIWRENHGLTEQSIVVYRPWVRRFVEYCRAKNLDPHTQLTLDGVRTFAKWYSRKRQIQANRTFLMARSALSTWALTLKGLGNTLPPWSMVSKHISTEPPLLREFSEHLRELRGSPEITIRSKLLHIRMFMAFLRRRHRQLQHVRLPDIDAYLMHCRKRFARPTVCDIGGSIRRFMNFLLETGRTRVDLAPLVTVPKVRPAERPYRAMPWKDVQRILRAVDRSKPCGRRDYALLLMMSTYGMGSGEVIRLTVDDLDWSAQTIHVIRPKTGVEFSLPLLPAVARGTSDYLRHGRPMHAQTRHLFITRKAPYKKLSGSSVIRGILHRHARHADVTAPFMGTHCLRHAHACRQMELGTVPKLIGDILGHRDPQSTSAYLRVTTERLRDMALAVPR
jgi:integrase/recombinase XerD